MAELESLLQNLRLDAPAWTPSKSNARSASSAGQLHMKTAAPAATHQKKQNRKVCRFYKPRNPTSCRFGSKCHFLHDDQGSAMGVKSQSAARHNPFPLESRRTLSKGAKSNRWHEPRRSSSGKAIASKAGHLANNKKASSVANSIKQFRFIVGTCRDMCPESERTRRKLEGTISTAEMEHESMPDLNLQKLMIKQYYRSAAGDDLLKACEVRPPHVLLRTARYICTAILDIDQNEKPDLRWRDDRRHKYNKARFAGDLERFVSDRFRMIGKDLAVQGFSASGYKVDACAIQCFEISVRYHLLISYVCRDAVLADFDPHLNWKALWSNASSLYNMYTQARLSQDAEAVRQLCANEDRMLSYIFLAMLPAPGGVHDESVITHAAKGIQMMISRLNKICPSLVQGPRVKIALQAIDAYISADYAFFMSLSKTEADPLFLCGLQAQFTHVRFQALKAINRAYRGNFRNTTMMTVLGCNSLGEAIEICKAAGLAIRERPANVSHEKRESRKIISVEHDIVLNYKVAIKADAAIMKGGMNPLVRFPVPAIEKYLMSHRRGSLVVGALPEDLECSNGRLCVDLKLESSAFVLKEDLSKARNKTKRQTSCVEVWVCVERSAILKYKTSVEAALALESKLLQHNPILHRCRLKRSVLDASGIENAVVIIFCRSIDIAKECLSKCDSAEGSQAKLVALPTSDLAKLVNREDAKNIHSLLSGINSTDLSKDILTRLPYGVDDIGHNLKSVLEHIILGASEIIPSSNSTDTHMLVFAMQRKNVKKSSDKSVKPVTTRLECPGGVRRFGESSWSCGVRCVNEICGCDLLSCNMPEPPFVKVDEIGYHICTI